MLRLGVAARRATAAAGALTRLASVVPDRERSEKQRGVRCVGGGVVTGHGDGFAPSPSPALAFAGAVGVSALSVKAVLTEAAGGGAAAAATAAAGPTVSAGVASFLAVAPPACFLFLQAAPCVQRRRRGAARGARWHIVVQAQDCAGVPEGGHDGHARAAPLLLPRDKLCAAPRSCCCDVRRVSLQTAPSRCARACAECNSHCRRCLVALWRAHVCVTGRGGGGGAAAASVASCAQRT